MAPEILNEFHEVEASFVSDDLFGTIGSSGILANDTYKYEEYHYGWRIDVTLRPPGNPQDSPYHHIFTPEYEYKYNVRRHLETSVYCRGDNRTIHGI